jgi:hypothetical protein
VSVTVTVELPDELAARISAAAATRGMTVEQLAVEVLASRYTGQPSISFIGVGASGGLQSPARDHHRTVRDAFRDRPARDV